VGGRSGRMGDRGHAPVSPSNASATSPAIFYIERNPKTVQSIATFSLHRQVALMWKWHWEPCTPAREETDTKNGLPAVSRGRAARVADKRGQDLAQPRVVRAGPPHAGGLIDDKDGDRRVGGDVASDSEVVLVRQPPPPHPLCTDATSRPATLALDGSQRERLHFREGFRRRADANRRLPSRNA
jgi:hypothetical protein